MLLRPWSSSYFLRARERWTKGKKGFQDNFCVIVRMCNRISMQVLNELASGSPTHQLYLHAVSDFTFTLRMPNHWIQLEDPNCLVLCFSGVDFQLYPNTRFDKMYIRGDIATIADQNMENSFFDKNWYFTLCEMAVRPRLSFAFALTFAVGGISQIKSATQEQTNAK